jgi:hypothetical protein
MERPSGLRAFIAAECLLSKAWLLLAVLSLVLVICSLLPPEYDTWWIERATALPVVVFGFSIFVFTSGDAAFLASLPETRKRLPLLYWVCLFLSVGFLVWILLAYVASATTGQSAIPSSWKFRIVSSIEFTLSVCMFGFSHWASGSKGISDAG